MAVGGAGGPRTYIHELVDIRGHRRADYLQHVTANWGPIGRVERGQRCFGVWATVGSTGRWPQVVNLWEYDSWAALARNFEVELVGGGLQDPALAEWWAAADEMRSGGLDRILVAPGWSPSIDDLCAGGERGAAGYAHETVRLRPGAAARFLDSVHEDGIDAYGAAGLRLIGAFATAMRDDDEVILVWSFPTWSTWADFEVGTSRAPARWRADRRDLTVAWERFLLADAPLSPLRTGRQPDVSDRRPLS